MAYGGIIILSPDSLLIRLVNCDIYSTVVMRGIFMSLMLALMMVIFPRFRKNIRWKPMLWCGISYYIGLVTFPLSILHTYAANTLVIIASAPVFAAVGGYLFIKQVTAGSTWIAMGVILISIIVILSDSFSSGTGLLGDFFAVCTALSLAVTSIIVFHHPNNNFFPSLLVGSVLTTLTFIWFADWQTVETRDVAIMALDGTIVAGLPFVLLITAAKYLPPAEFNLSFLLETVLGPIWVWLVLTETPPSSTLVIFTVVVPVLVINSIISARRTHKKSR